MEYYQNSSSTLCTEDNTINITDVDTGLDLILSATERLSILMFYSILILVGWFGNIMFLYTVYRVPSMRTVTNAYLSSIAVADIMYSLQVGISYTRAGMVVEVRSGFPHISSTDCILNMAIVFYFYFTTTLLITLVSVERFYAVCLPLRHMTVAGMSRTKKLIAASWLGGFVLTAVSLPGFGQLEISCIIWPDAEEFNYLKTTSLSCSTKNYSVGTQIYSMLISLFLYCTFLVINAIMYVGIIKAVKNRATLNIGDNQEQSIQIRNQVAKLLVINGTVAFTCQTPQRMYVVLKTFAQIMAFDIPSWFSLHIRVIAVLFVCLNSVINPYIYVSCSKSYREAFLQALHFKTDTKSSDSGTKPVTIAQTRFQGENCA